MAYGDFKDLARITASDKVLRDKALNFANNLKYYGYQWDLASKTYRFFEKKSSGGTIKNEIKQNKLLAGELNKAIIVKVKKRKAY